MKLIIPNRSNPIKLSEIKDEENFGSSRAKTLVTVNGPREAVSRLLSRALQARSQRDDVKLLKALLGSPAG